MFRLFLFIFTTLENSLESLRFSACVRISTPTAVAVLDVWQVNVFFFHFFFYVSSTTLNGTRLMCHSTIAMYAYKTLYCCTSNRYITPWGLIHARRPVQTKYDNATVGTRQIVTEFYLYYIYINILKTLNY